MDGQPDADRDWALMGVDNSAAEGDGDRGRYSTMMRCGCTSQSSPDESSQRPALGDSGWSGGAQHATKLLEALARLRRDATLCDVRLHARCEPDQHAPAPPPPPSPAPAPQAAAPEPAESSDRSEPSEPSEPSNAVYAHRAVLAACSPYFHAMFTQFDERTQPTVTIQNVEPSALEAIVEYVYTPESLVISEDNVQSLLSAASLLQVLGVREACCAFLAAALAPDNALGVRAFAELHAHAELCLCAQRYVEHHFVENVEPSALEAIVEYVYTPESLVISEDNVQSLLSAASLLQVLGVREACCAFLAAALAPDNALGVRAFAELHAHAELCLCAQRYVEHHFVEVLETEEFLTLEADTLAALLDSDRITVPDEEVVLDAVVRWMRHAPETRAGQLGALLEHVRLPLVAQDKLAARAAAEPLVSAGLRVKDLLIEALSFHLLRPERRTAIACARARPRQPPRSPKALLVVGGQAPEPIRDVEAFHIDCGRWRAVAELPTRRSCAGVASVGAKVYVVGGYNGTQYVRSVDVYDVGADTWSAGPPLTARRAELGVAAIGHVIYAVGGFDGAKRLSSTKALDTREGTWRAIAPMSTRRSYVGVGVLGGKLYAVGGYNSTSRQSLHTVERYEPAADAWLSVEEMDAGRWGCGVGVAEGALFAVGGYDGSTVLRSVERYRPGQGWAPAPPLHTPRRAAAVAAHLGRLYVVGGDDGAVDLNTVEVFDPATDSWSMLGAAMAVGRCGAGVAVVELAA